MRGADKKRAVVPCLVKVKTRLVARPPVAAARISCAPDADTSRVAAGRITGSLTAPNTALKHVVSPPPLNPDTEGGHQTQNGCSATT